MSSIDLIVLFGYFAVMIAIGWWASRSVNNQEDYFMGGRGFGKLLQTFAAFGAGTGAHEPVTVGRTGWTSGLSGVWSAMMWLFVTPVYWITAVWYRRMRHLTLGDWFVERYNSQALGVAYTLFAIVFYMFYLSTMLSAVAKFSVPLMNTETLFGVDAQYILVPGIAVVVIFYGVLGGLTAAYWTDLIQGVFIILLSVLLIPYGLWQLAEKFGETVTMADGARVLHQRISEDYFALFSGPASGEFPVQYIVSLTLLSLVGIVVQPHFIATGGGSAKSEFEARVGLVAGNFLKRLCTVGWAMTALIALALFAGQVEIASDPDKVWGVAAREILGPLNVGLVGLMMACLLAAMMSSADTYMIVTSALVVRNLYAPYIEPNADEKRYVFVGRATGLVIVVGASAIAISMSDVFGQFKMAIELPILFAAPFWIGMYWRRTGKLAVWGTIAFSSLVFFILPVVIPALRPELRTSKRLLAATEIVEVKTTRQVTPSDIERYEAWVEARKEIEETELVPADRDAALTRLGAQPPKASDGETITVLQSSGGKPIFWQGGIVERDGTVLGTGALQLDLLVYSALGFELSGLSAATLQTLRLPSRLLMPFVVLIGLSLMTPRPPADRVESYFLKMNTPVDPDPIADANRLEFLYANPEHATNRKLWPESDWEFTKPTVQDWVGFAVSVFVCGVVITLLVLLAGWGA